VTGERIYQLVFTISSALELPVVLLALASLAAVLYQAGAFAVEVLRRRRRVFARLAGAATTSRQLLDDGDRDGAVEALAPVAWSVALAESYRNVVDAVGTPGGESVINKNLADFEFDRQRKLGHTRLLVRIGPALGLMGTLIPLSPALEGLAQGNITALTDNLRIAFSITVLGLLVGALAFAISLVRERLYGQDYSDLEYVAAVLTSPADEVPVAPMQEGTA